ncbi:MAG: hypothetical protein AB1921_18130 [Thermodesulfobacteriota bacterium]
MKVTVINRKRNAEADNDFLTPDFGMIALAYCRCGLENLTAGKRTQKGAR